MNKWTWVVVVVLVAVLGLAYSVISQPHVTEQAADRSLSVEEFDAPESATTDDSLEVGADEMPGDEAAAEVVASDIQAAMEDALAPEAELQQETAVDTIDDADENGETVPGPTVIEDDEDRGQIEIAQPKTDG